MALVSRAVIKSDWLNIAAIDTSKDAMLDRFIAYVGSEIKDICQQPIEQESVTINFGGNSDKLYYTGYTVPTTLTSLASRDDYGDSYVAVAGTTNLVDIRGTKHIFLSDGFTALDYQAVLSVGYTSVPTVIEICAAEMVTELYMTTPFAPQSSRFGVTAISESEGGISISKTLQRMRDRVKSRLAPYMRASI